MLEEEETYLQITIAKSWLEEEGGCRGLLRICKSLGENRSATICFHNWDDDGISTAMADEERWRGVK